MKNYDDSDRTQIIQASQPRFFSQNQHTSGKLTTNREHSLRTQPNQNKKSQI